MFFDKVRETVKKNNLLEYGDCVVCAVSGGADSMCLLYSMIELREEYNLTLYIANVNHLIRGKESDDDSEFVKTVAEKTGIQLFYREYDVIRISNERKIGEEECGRELRYEFFEEVASKLGGAKIATAHNLNDNAETVLFRMARGTSPKGMCGIKYKRNNIIRPLLDVTRNEIEAYLKENNLAWREDSTNSIPVYARNKIRLEVIPKLREVSSSADEKVVAVSKFISEDNSFIEEYAMEREKECFSENSLNLEEYSKLHISIKRRIAASVLVRWGIKELTAEKIEDFLDFINKDSGKIFDINGKVHIRKSYDKIVCCSKNETTVMCEILDENNSVEKGIWKLSVYRTKENVKKNGNNLAIFDADKLCTPFEVTFRRDGDRIKLKGSGTKKVSDIFTDTKTDAGKRAYIPIVRKGEDIVYIGGLRQSSLFDADSETKEYLIIKYEEREGLL